MRKLVTIRVVDSISPIDGADKIELAHIGGWQCVVKKGEFHAGDSGLFFEIDSWLPSTDDRFKFLGTPKNWNGKEGYRLRTMKLRGQLSQGLLLPVSLFPEVLERFSRDVGEGSESDYSEILGIEKWERPVSPQMQGQARGNFPSFIPKTDQERIQNLSGAWDKLKQKEYEVTQKLDGSSMTVYHYNGETGVCSRNLELKVDEENAGNAFIKVAIREQLMEKLKQYGENLAIQGELMGPGIQGNPEMLEDHHFFLYDVWDIDNAEYFRPQERITLARNLEIQHVPMIASEFTPGNLNIKDILLLAEGGSSISENKVREGLVFKAIDGTVSWKAISNVFLLKGGD